MSDVSKTNRTPCALLTLDNNKIVAIEYPVLKRIMKAAERVVYHNRDKSKRMPKVDTQVLATIILLEVSDSSLKE